MRPHVFLLTALIFGAAAPAQAKRPLDRISVEGPGLKQPIDLTDSRLLRLSNPWFGSFLEPNTAQPAPPNASRVYVLTLHARLRGPQVQPIYRFHYVPTDDGTPGCVYLPGKGDQWYRQNVSIMLRPAGDGIWHQATRAWAAYWEEAWRAAGSNLPTVAVEQ